MTKTYTAILAFFCAISLSAQDSYYYYKGEKIPLEIDNTKIVAISYIENNSGLKSSQGYIQIESINDGTVKAELYELSSTVTLTDALNTNPIPKDISITPCFKSYSNKLLIPVGYIDLRLKKSEDFAILKELSHEMSFEIVSQNPFMPLWYSLRITPGNGRNPIKIANELYETHIFASSSPSFAQNIEEISYDPFVHEQWGLYNSSNPNYDISVSEAWNYSTGKDVVIAIIDSGVDLQHPDLKDNAYSKCYDIVSGKNINKIYYYHGTHCAGIAAAVRNNGNQIAGVAPDAKIMSVCTPTTLFYINQLANGINWAWKNGADIISCSWGTGKYDCITEAIDSALVCGRSGKGCIFINSAGNEGKKSGEITFPGNYRPEILAVSNLTSNGSISDDSSHGDNMFVAAPGTNILSTIPNGELKIDSGTSMACPHVAGVAALILSRNPNLTAAEVREIIAKSAIKIGTKPYNIMKEFGLWNEYYGYGILNAANAVKNTPKQ